MRRVRDLLRGDAGLSMTELAVAIVLLSMVVAGLAPLMANSVLLAQKNANVGEANRLVAAVLDETRAEVRATSCSAVAGLNTADLSSSEFSTAGSTKFRVERNVTCSDRLATVTLSAFDRNAADGAESLTSATTQVVAAP